MTERLRNEIHHWWPRSLSQFWAGTDGHVHQLTPDGNVIRSLPPSFGGIKNAHHIKFRGNNTLWNSTFEPEFSIADSQFPDLINWLLNLDSKVTISNDDFLHRLMPQPLSPDWREKLAHCLASLTVRSPSTRHRIKITVERYRAQMGLLDITADKNLIARNLGSLYDTHVDLIRNGGKFLVLFTDSAEFVFGDGFLHNFPTLPNLPLSARCVVPLTPCISIVFVRPMQYRSQPELLTIRLDNKEVDFFNQIVQIYSCERLFYRRIAPQLIRSFVDSTFCEFQYHKHPQLDRLINAYIEFPHEPSPELRYPFL